MLILLHKLITLEEISVKTVFCISVLYIVTVTHVRAILVLAAFVVTTRLGRAALTV